MGFARARTRRCATVTEHAVSLARPEETIDKVVGDGTGEEHPQAVSSDGKCIPNTHGESSVKEARKSNDIIWENQTCNMTMFGKISFGLTARAFEHTPCPGGHAQSKRHLQSEIV